MQLDRSISEGQDESRNTSFLERTTIVKLGIMITFFRRLCRDGLDWKPKSFLLLMFII